MNSRKLRDSLIGAGSPLRIFVVVLASPIVMSIVQGGVALLRDGIIVGG